VKPVLLDTHAFLWFVFDDPRLSEVAAKAIADPEHEKVVSIASLWEIAIKTSLGKLELGMSLERFFATEIEGRELRILAISSAHLLRAAALPFHHRDPFDRLVIAQAEVEHLPIVTSDANFALYGATIVW
jgi:PIN domain nuclease of toxin-antitoxin system